MANVNATKPLRFEEAGVLTWTKSAADSVILNTEPDSIAFTPTLPERIEYSDRGVPQIPLEGDLGYCEMEFSYRATKPVATTGIYALLMAAGAAGLVNQGDSCNFKIPDYRGASAGTSITLTAPWLAEPLAYKAGGGNGRIDVWSVKLRSTSCSVTTY